MNKKRIFLYYFIFEYLLISVNFMYLCSLNSTNQNSKNTKVLPKSSGIQWFFNTSHASQAVRSVDISGNGSNIVAGGFANDMVYYFDKSSSTPLWSYTTDAQVYSVSISKNATHIVVGTNGGRVYFFNTSTTMPKTPEWIYNTGHSVRSVDLSEDGKYAVAGTYDLSDHDSFLLFNTTNKANPHLWSYTAGNTVKSVSINYDGFLMAVGARADNGDDNVSFFNRNDNIPEWQYNTKDEITSVDISIDGKFVSAGNEGNKVFLFNTSNYAKPDLWNYTDVQGSKINSVSISADGQYIAAGGDGMKLRVFIRENSVPIMNGSLNSEINEVAISSDGKQIVGVDHFKYVYLFKATDSSPKGVYDLGSSDNWGESAAISGSGKHFVVGTGYSGLGPYIGVFYINDIETNGGNNDDDSKEPPSTDVGIIIAIVAIISLAIVIPIVIVLKKKSR